MLIFHTIVDAWAGCVKPHRLNSKAISAVVNAHPFASAYLKGGCGKIQIISIRQDVMVPELTKSQGIQWQKGCHAAVVCLMMTQQLLTRHTCICLVQVHAVQADTIPVLASNVWLQYAYVTYTACYSNATHDWLFMSHSCCTFLLQKCA